MGTRSVRAGFQKGTLMSLPKISVVIALILVALAAPLRGGERPGKDGKDTIVGAIWTYTLSKEGEKDVKGTFRVYDGVIYKESEKVGTVKPKDRDDSVLEFTGLPELNGTATLKKSRDGHAAGTLIKKDKSEWKMV